MGFYQELLRRWTLESPCFHKKIIESGKWLLATSIALTALPAGYEVLFPNAGIDLAVLIKISSYMGLAGLIISIVAGTTVKDINKI